MKKNTVLILMLLLSSLLVRGQDQFNPWYRSVGLNVDLAFSAKSEQLPEGYAYSPISFLGRYRFMHLGPFDIYSEAQFARAADIEGVRKDYEFGLNLGLSYQVPIAPNLIMISSLGSGPYFITVETRRQANGFIFSDNLELGLKYYGPLSNTGIQIRARYRHFSNAGLKSPNGGIDNLFVILGVTKLL